MKTMSLMPVVGMKTEGDDTRLIEKTQDGQRVYFRDIADADIERGGAVRLRPGLRKVTDLPLANLWQSPLHGDVFATLGDTWVKVGQDWVTEPLATVGEGECWHLVLNNRVLLSAPFGVFEYDGAAAQRVTIDTPAAPMILPLPGAGSLVGGAYTAALAYLREGKESALSDLTTVDVAAGSGIEVILPMGFNPSVSQVRLYLSQPNGTLLGRAGDYPVTASSAAFSMLPALGIAPRFQHMETMPTGKYLSLWQGRLLTARRNVLHFSEPLAYHINDPRHGFIQMPQRITFLAPVEGGIWVGQVDHVAFLHGTEPNQLVAQKRAGKPPIPGSALPLSASSAGEDASQGGRFTVAWLAQNGYVLGTASGEIIETAANKMGGIFAQQGFSVQVGDRLHTLIR